MSVRTHPSQWVSAQGQYAGSASRFAAYLTDLIASTVLYWLALQLVSFVVQTVTGSPVSWHRQNIAVLITYIAWQFLYFGFQWAADGSTWGMALLGVQVVRADGTRLHPWQGWVRSLTFPLGFLTLGLGFLGILVQRENRALYDLIAGTTVVYAWDARAARFRYLARQAEPVADAAHGPGTAKPAAVTADRSVPDDQTTSTADLLVDGSRSAGCPVARLAEHPANGSMSGALWTAMSAIDVHFLAGGIPCDRAPSLGSAKPDRIRRP